jgi:pimeloyl-ACP methyl ester carboxylesterase
MIRFIAVSVLAAAALAVAAASAAEAAAPTSAPLQTARLPGATLGYRVLHPHAKGRPLVLVAGFGVTMAEWDPLFVERLARGRRTVVFDNRGMGNSTGSVAGLTIERLARDTVALIRTLKLGRADLIGWSMGGSIAQRVALDAPRRVGRLVLASANAGSPRAVQPSDEVVAVLTNPDTTPEQMLTVLFPPDRHAAAEAWMARIAAQPNLAAADFATPPVTMAAQSLAAGPRWYGRGDGTLGQLWRLRAPTLIAYGKDDVIVAPSNAMLIDSRIPHAAIKGYTDAGHAFLFQDPTGVAARFAAFLDRG